MTKLKKQQMEVEVTLYIRQNPLFSFIKSMPARSTRGSKGYSLSAMVRAFIAKQVCGIPTVTQLVERLKSLQWINNRNMPAHKVGRLWKFKISEVDDWIRSGGAADKGELNSAE